MVYMQDIHQLSLFSSTESTRHTSGEHLATWGPKALVTPSGVGVKTLFRPHLKIV